MGSVDIPAVRKYLREIFTTSSTEVINRVAGILSEKSKTTGTNNMMETLDQE